MLHGVHFMCARDLWLPSVTLEDLTQATLGSDLLVAQAVRLWPLLTILAPWAQSLYIPRHLASRCICVWDVTRAARAREMLSSRIHQILRSRPLMPLVQIPRSHSARQCLLAPLRLSSQHQLTIPLQVRQLHQRPLRHCSSLSAVMASVKAALAFLCLASNALQTPMPSAATPLAPLAQPTATASRALALVDVMEDTVSPAQVALCPAPCVLSTHTQYQQVALLATATMRLRTAATSLCLLARTTLQRSRLATTTTEDMCPLSIVRLKTT